MLDDVHDASSAFAVDDRERETANGKNLIRT
jgi:hypothetical protein